MKFTRIIIRCKNEANNTKYMYVVYGRNGMSGKSYKSRWCSNAQMKARENNQSAFV